MWRCRAKEGICAGHRDLCGLIQPPPQCPRGLSGCLKKSLSGAYKFRVSHCRVAELWRGRSSNELEYCLLGGRSLWVEHQIKGGPALLLERQFRYATGQSKRAQTLILKEENAWECLILGWQIVYYTVLANLGTGWIDDEITLKH